MSNKQSVLFCSVLLSNSLSGILKCSTEKEKIKDYIEFKVYLIHWKQAPLHHNTDLIICYEGVGLVGVII